MIQKQPHQVVTVGVFSFDNDMAENLIKSFGTTQIITEAKKINLFYQKLTSLNVYKKTSLFQHAIYIVPDLEFSEKDWSNRNFMVLKLLQQHKYKQILLLFLDDQEINEKDNQLKQRYQWVQKEIDAIFNDFHLKEEEQNPLKLPIPEIKILSQIKQQDLLDFFTFQEETQLAEQQLWMSIIKQHTQSKASAIVISGYLTNKQTVISNKYQPPQKGTIDEMFDYFTKKPINFARQGDIIVIEYTSPKQLEGVISGLYSTGLDFKKEIQCDLVFQMCGNAGFAHRFEKGSFRFFYYGLEMILVKQVIKGLKVEGKVQKPADHQTQQPYQAIFKINNITFLPPQIKNNIISCFNVDSKKFKGPMNWYCKMEIPEVQIVQPPKRSMLLIEKIITPAPESMMINGVDYRQKCRVCKEGKPNFAPQECGHLRYCADCQTIPVEAKACLYCDTPCTSVINFNTELTVRKILTLKHLTPQQVIDYFGNDSEKELPDYVALENEVNISKEQYITFNCSKCDLLITHYQFCKNNHRVMLCSNCSIKSCETCQLEMSPKKQIIYIFPDDPTS